MLNVRRLEERIALEMQEAKVPGLALAVVHGAQIVYARGFGVTGVEDAGLPVSPQTLFRIGSLTKSFTATCVMHLVERGYLALDRPIVEYLPRLELSEGAEKRITLRMLLSHTSGLPSHYNPFGKRDPEALEEYVRTELPGFDLVAPPGTLWHYSNLGFRIAGYLAEAVAGKPYADLVREVVFDPLGLSRTTFDTTVAMTYPLAQSHDLKPDGTLAVQHQFGDNAGSNPSGYIISTVLDIGRYALMHLGRGSYDGAVVLSPESVAEMHGPQADLYTVDGDGYGLGFFLDEYRGVRRVGHGGVVNTFGTRCWMVPEADTAVVLTFNRVGARLDADGIVDDIFTEILGLPEGRPPVTSSPGDGTHLSRYAGTYLSLWSGLSTISVEGGRLVLDWNGTTVRLDPAGRHVYYGQAPGRDGWVSVGLPPQEGTPRYIMLNGRTAQRTALEASFQAPPAGWERYEGRYWGDFHDVELRIRQGRLVISSDPAGREMDCAVLSDGRFACDLGIGELGDAHDGSRTLRLGEAATLRRVE